MRYPIPLAWFLLAITTLALTPAMLAQAAAAFAA
jgi:hypothetical protein